jgi:hypothetical protein
MMTDWKEYYARRRDEVATFLSAAREVLARVGPPRADPKQGESRMGRPPYDSGAMLIVNLLRMYWKKTYRDMASFLAANPGLREELGLPRAPAHDTIHRYAEALPEAYLEKFNAELTRRLKKTSSASASTPPVSRSRSTRDVGALPRTGSGRTRSTGSNSTP